MPSRRLRQLAAGAAPPPDLALPDPTAAATVSENRNNIRHPAVLPAVITTGVCLLLVVFAAAAFLLFRAGRRRRSDHKAPTDLAATVDQGREEISSVLPLKEPHRFSYEVLRSATASFSQLNKLGQGGFGPVFRGVLGDGREIAVKVMEGGSLQGEREFRNELALASSMMQGGDDDVDPSRFVVSCVGFCSDDDQGGVLQVKGKSKRRKKKKKKKKKKSARVEELDKWGIKGRKRRGGSISSAFSEDEEGSVSCCEEQESGRRLLLVYKLMSNGSLQDALLDRRCPELMNWSRRFSIALDVAKGIAFLHTICDPAVIHGDVKPSNILLDANFSAKIADFGLARILIPSVIPTYGDDASMAMGDDLSMTVAETESVGTTTVDEMSHYMHTPSRGAGSRAHGTASLAISKESPGLEVEIGGSMRLSETDGVSPIAMTLERTIEAGSTSEFGGAYDKMSVESGVELLTPGGRRWWKKNGSESQGRDWWWRQDPVPSNVEKPDFSGRSSVRDYVMEWIGSELRKERLNADWENHASSSTRDSGHALPPKKSDRKKSQRRLEWWARKKGKNRPAREWWREEFCEELTRKNNNKKDAIKVTSGDAGAEKGKQWWERDDDVEEPSFRRKSRKAWSRGSRSSLDRGIEGCSGDVPKSGGVSSTPSMRGTVCYAAPEYGAGGLLSEKCDIYSFGVLLLVIVSGRRPLQVTASPMADFERANLISWARHLARADKLMDLVDPSLRSLDKDQALLCITIALLCLQRSPARRPMIKEVVDMLTGESELPHLPLEFSPSPPGFPYKSQRRPR